MPVKINDIIDSMEKYAPHYLAEDWDNVGLMIGERDREVSRILVALDVNDQVIDEAVDSKADLIITHHPFIFKSIKSVTDESPLGRRIIKLIRNNISVFSAHTNLDASEGGTNATLAKLLKLENIQGLADIIEEENAAMGRIGNLKETVTFEDFVAKVKTVLGVENLSVCGDLTTSVRRVGICTGKGASYMQAAADMGADVFITGDFGYHEGQTAADLGLCVIDGTHYLTEVIVVQVLAGYIADKFKEVEVICSEVDGQTLKIV